MCVICSGSQVLYSVVINNAPDAFVVRLGCFCLTNETCDGGEFYIEYALVVVLYARLIGANNAVVLFKFKKGGQKYFGM